MNLRFMGLLLATLAALPAAAEEHRHNAGAEGKAKDMGKMWQAALARPALSATTAFDAEGRLWQAVVQDAFLYIRHSDDMGKTFSSLVAVNPTPERIAADGENRPKILAGGKGRLFVSYTQSLDKPFSGNIRFSRSLDGGKTFSPPVTVNDNHEIISHRFEAMGINKRGHIYLAWLDKRDLSAAAQKGEAFTGASVYYAVSEDDGASFSPNRRVAEHTCECCRVSMAMDTDGLPVIFWRHIYGQNTRDFALAKLDGRSSPARATHDNWQIDACPHHGGSISIGPDGVQHLVWFNNGPERHGLFYASSRAHGQAFSTPKAFGKEDAQASHPDVLSLGRKIFVVWKEFDGKEASVQEMHSSDGGGTWSGPRRLAATAGASDHPLLISHQGRAYLSWQTEKDGLQLVETGLP